MIPNKYPQPLLINTMALVLVLAVGHAQESKLRIVYSSPSLTYPWQAQAAKVAQDEARKLDVDLLLQDGEASSPKQESDLRAALNLGVDGIVLDPNDVDALTAATNDVLDAGIPIVTFDRIVRNPHKPIPYFGLDNVAAGTALVKYVINRLPDGARIVFITGKPGGSSANERAKGVRDGIKAAGDKYKVVAEQTGNWSREEALNVTQNILTSLGYTPEAVIAANDDMALGALAAIEQAGIPKGKIVVVGIDGLPEALAKIRDGEMAASVQFPLMQVRLALEALVAHLHDHKVIEGKLLDALVIEKSNLQQADRYSAIKYK
jgi:inositol transport system substrate-binding protein